GLWRLSPLRCESFGGSRSRIRKQAFQFAFRRAQIQPMKLSTRNGYPRVGSGLEIGNSGSPQKILAEEIAKSKPPIKPAMRVAIANSFGTLTRARPADHSAVPAANAGTLATRVCAVPPSMTASPIV